MKKYFLLMLSIFCLFSSSSAYTSEYMKGVWVATVYNLDYPKSSTMDENVLKSEAVTILDNISKLGFKRSFTNSIV